MNHRIGDIKVLKFRDITVAGTPLKWKYFASSNNRYFKSDRRFGERTYKHLNDMAKDINEVINDEEEIKLVQGNLEIRIKPNEAIQYSNLDNDELSELAKKILLLRAKSKLEVVAQD